MPGSASDPPAASYFLGFVTFVVGQSWSKELWVDISWARNQGLHRVDGPINPQRAAWSDRFEFQIVDLRQERWLKVTRVDTNKGWGQQLRARMTSSMIEAEQSNASRTPKPSSTPPPSKQLASTGAPSELNRPGIYASSSARLHSPPPLQPKPISVPTPGSASGSKRQWAQTPTEDYVRKKLAEEQRSAAVAAGKTSTDSHRLWLDKKYEKRSQKRLAKQSAKEGFS